MKDKKVLNLVSAAMFLAIGLILPLFTGKIPQIGKMLLPMHLPVFLCGLICGWQYGLAVGFLLPLLSSALFSMPVLYPMGISMAFELAAYGALSGFLFSHARWQCIRSLYRCLLISMLCGRIVWGIAEGVLLGLGGNVLTLQAFITGAFLSSVPGIIIQLLLIPSIMLMLDKTHLVPFRNGEKVEGKAYAEK